MAKMFEVGWLLLMTLPALVAFSPAPAALRLSPTAAQRTHVTERHGARCVTSTRMQSSSDSIFDLATLIGASLARPGAGAFVAGYRVEPTQDYKNPTMDLPIREFSETLPSFRPAKPLELYEYEACPFCRKVREAVSMLDIDVIVYPCPRDGKRYRDKVIEMGGKSQVRVCLTNIYACPCARCFRAV